MKTVINFFPFDLFGSGGTAAGAQLLADGIREMIADNKRENTPTRSAAYQDKLSLKEFRFETLAEYESWRKKARQTIRRQLSQNHFPIWISGNHLGVLPAYDVLATDHPDTLIIQFDAHLDIYNLADCTDELSHGNFLLHCAGPLPSLVNIGHRELLLTKSHIDRYYKAAIPCEQVSINADQVFTKLRRHTKVAKQIFIDIDCDVLDAAYFPALSHPQPFGLSTSLLLRCLDQIWSKKVIGLSISEFDPSHDHKDRSLATVLWLIEYLLLRLYE